MVRWKPYVPCVHNVSLSKYRCHAPSPQREVAYIGRTSQRHLVHRSLKPKKSGIVAHGEYGHRVYRRGGSGNTMRSVLYRRSVPNDYRRFECRKNWRCWYSFETFVQFVERRKSIDSSDIVTDAASAERQLNESTKAAVSLVTASKSPARLCNVSTVIS
jgi:lactate dehydrogenase-like 2-hydroxyacid dehydrogenase